MNSGSFSYIDDKNNEVYNGVVKREKRLDIVIGLPASGKSSSLVNPLSEYNKSLVVDSDIVKTMLPEFNEGWGADIVHEESKDINAMIYKKALSNGLNIVLPIVGASTSSVEMYLNPAKELDYDIFI